MTTHLQCTTIGPDSFLIVEPTTALTRLLNSITALPNGQVCECHSV